MFQPIGQPGPDWRLLGFDPDTGKTAWMLLQDDGETLKVRTVMPVDEMLEENAQMRSMDSGNWAGDMHLVSRVPLHVWQRELAEAVQQDDQRYVSKWLNDSDHSRFRTKGGRV
ncbi:MAG: hypothetical protein ACJ8HI_23200 [Massilia sp.]